MKFMLLGALQCFAFLLLFDSGLGWPLWLAILASVAGVILTWTIPFALTVWRTQRDANRIFRQLDDLARFRDAHPINLG